MRWFLLITLAFTAPLLHASEIRPSSSPFHRAKSSQAVSSIRSVSVHADSCVWQKGVAYVRAGMVSRGLRLLDSLRCAGVDDPAFLRAYGDCAFEALIPRGKTDDNPEILLKPGPLTLADTLAPSSREWTTVRLIDPKAKSPALPSFTYGATFELRKPFHVVFSGLSGHASPVMRLQGAPDPVLPKLLADQLDTRAETATCRLFIDLENVKSPVHEYLTRRVDGVYDSISMRKELSGVSGVSMRGYTWSGRHYADGRFTAIATFDRPLPDLVQTGRGERHSTENRTVRYTLVVRSSVASQAMSEAKFQSLLRALL